jgi:hypothetical protein
LSCGLRLLEGSDLDYSDFDSLRTR